LCKLLHMSDVNIKFSIYLCMWRCLNGRESIICNSRLRSYKYKGLSEFRRHPRVNNFERCKNFAKLSSCHVVSHLHDRDPAGFRREEGTYQMLFVVLYYRYFHMLSIRWIINIYPQPTTLRQIRENKALDEKELQEAVNQLK
jgi:hypothetical protein